MALLTDLNLATHKHPLVHDTGCILLPFKKAVDTAVGAVVHGLVLGQLYLYLPCHLRRRIARSTSVRFELISSPSTARPHTPSTLPTVSAHRRTEERNDIDVLLGPWCSSPLLELLQLPEALVR